MRLSYEDARAGAASEDVSVRLDIARHPGCAPEVLFFLAEDVEDVVRMAVAGNDHAPAKANLVLADDPEQEVRRALAEKLSRTAGMADLDEEDRDSRINRTSLARLLEDQAARVRAVIASVLKEDEKAEPTIISKLARDTDILVCGPVLEYSSLLSDEDLLQVINAYADAAALAAIARRRAISSTVTDAIVDTGVVPAITVLLKNPTATIREATLDRLIDRAAAIAEWHEPLVHRPELTSKGAMKLASFVADHLIERMLAREDIDSDTAARIRAVVQERMEQSPAVKPGESTGVLTQAAVIQAMETVLAMARENNLNEAALTAAVEAGDRSLVTAALAKLAGVPPSVATRVIESLDPKALCALSWKAGLSAKFAMALQIKVGRIPPGDVVAAKADDSFAMAARSMQWHLDMYLSGS